MVDVSNPLVWRTINPGEATLTARFEGKAHSVKWAVFDWDGTSTEPLPVSLRVESLNSGQVELSWPVSADIQFQLQFSDRLGHGANWQNEMTVPETPAAYDPNARFRVVLDSTEKARFYRLKSSP